MIPSLHLRTPFLYSFTDIILAQSICLISVRSYDPDPGFARSLKNPPNENVYTSAAALECQDT